MDFVVSIMLAVLGILLIVVFALTWMLFDLSCDVTELAKLCKRSCEAQTRQTETKKQ